MNKKLLLIPVGILLLIVVIIGITDSSDIHLGDNFIMNIPVNDSTSGNLKRVDLYMDNSGSMRGFVDMTGINGARTNMVPTVGVFLNTVYDRFSIEGVCHYSSNVADRNTFLIKLGQSDVFNGAITEVDKEISSLVGSCNDSSLVIFVSDMMLSYGKSAAARDMYINYHKLPDLMTSVNMSMTALKKKGLHVVLVQYLGDYNARYYCNCTENIIKSDLPIDNFMRNRPFYMFLMGSDKVLKSVISSGCLGRYNNIYTSFGQQQLSFDECSYSVDTGNSNWAIGFEEEYDGVIYSNAPGSGSAKLKFTCNKFYLPEYMATSYERLIPKFDSTFVQSCSSLSIIPNGLECTVTIKPYDMISGKGEICPTTVSYYCDNITDFGNIDNDVQNSDGTSVTYSELEGRTFSIGATIEAINRAFFNSPEKQSISLVDFKFNILKEK